MTRSKDTPKIIEESSRPEGAPEGTPLRVQRYVGRTDAGPEMSNADLNFGVGGMSADAAFSVTVPNPNPNPQNLSPAPGPSALEVLGQPKPEQDREVTHG
jgi:hypothetical protein